MKGEDLLGLDLVLFLLVLAQERVVWGGLVNLILDGLDVVVDFEQDVELAELRGPLGDDEVVEVVLPLAGGGVPRREGEVWGMDAR